MLEIAKLSGRFRVRRMTDADADEILALCAPNTLFYRYSGRPLSREGILSDLRATPPRTPEEAKYYLGFYDGQTLAAVMDLIEGYPEGEIAFIGFFMMNRDLQDRQIGTGIIQDACRYLREAGMKRLRLGINQGNPQAAHFWTKNGFRVVEEARREGGIILLAEKVL